MLIDRQQIAQLIPHGESMCLLDQITEWDEHHINAITASHSRMDNPLIEDGKMDAVALVEYGAQAAAVHAALLQSGLGAGDMQPAYLGAIKKLRLFTQFVDTNAPELHIQAHCIHCDSSGAIYDIQASIEEDELIKGRVVLVQPS